MLSVAQMRTAHGSDAFFLHFLAKDLHSGHVQQLRRLHRLFVCTQAFPVEQRDSIQYGTTSYTIRTTLVWTKFDSTKPHCSMQDHEKAMMMKIRDAKMRSVLRPSWYLHVAAILQYLAMVYSSFFWAGFLFRTRHPSLKAQRENCSNESWMPQIRKLKVQHGVQGHGIDMHWHWDSSYFFIFLPDSSYIFLPSLVPGHRSPVPQEERLRVALRQQVRMRPQGQLSLHWSAPELAPPWIGCRPWKIACLAEFWTTFVQFVQRCATPENWQNRNPFSTPKDPCVKSGFGNWDGGCRHGSQLNRSWTIVEPFESIWGMSLNVMMLSYTQWGSWESQGGNSKNRTYHTIAVIDAFHGRLQHLDAGWIGWIHGRTFHWKACFILFLFPVPDFE